MTDQEQREVWGTKWGLILAAAGNAVGIGNLLRFPAQAGRNGGGAFMIPYVVSLILFGLPMMWVAWASGRLGGRHGHGTTPGIFEKLWPSRAAKYLGVIGLVIPLAFCFYYAYIESWCLGYAWFSLTRDYVSTPGHLVDLPTYYNEYLGNASTHSYFPGYSATLTFAVITVLLNVWILYRGVVRGIELLAKIAMPALVLFCLVLVVRVFSLDPVRGSVWDGLAFLWTPDLSALGKPAVWLAAAGQIFFTLSIGFASLEVYASYLKDHDDVALTGLTTVGANEFVEVIFGSLIAIPACAVFFGGDQIQSVASSGSFTIGMISMPEVLRSFPGVEFFGTVWFLLLFFAAFTSSVATAQPVMAFFQDEAKQTRGTSAMLVGLFWLLGTIPCVFFTRYGAVDELDFWAGTLGLVVFAIIEAVLFAWVFGIHKGWKELHLGALIRVPSIFKYVIKYVTPVLLIGIFIGWFIEAIAKDTLVPAPTVEYTVVDRAEYPGAFRTRAPAGESAEQQAERVQAAADAETAVKAQVNLLQRDLTAWADLEIGPDGALRVVRLDGDPYFLETVDAAGFQGWIDGEGLYYEAPADRKAAAGEESPRRVRLMIEALHRSPYIWLIRLILLGLLGAFAVMVHSIWQKRQQSAAPAAGEGKPA